VRAASNADPSLAKGLSTLGGKLLNQPVAEALDLPFTEPAGLLAG